MDQEPIYEQQSLGSLCEEKLVIADGNMCVANTKQNTLSDCMSLAKLYRLIKPNLCLVPHNPPATNAIKLNSKLTGSTNMPQPQYDSQTKDASNMDLQLDERLVKMLEVFIYIENTLSTL